MLIELTIQNFTIIPKATVQFAQGMSVLTGETGAGKSIIIDALGLILGNRADSQTVRPGAKQAQISAIFVLGSHSEAYQWLAQHDLLDDETCIIRRTIHDNGRSQAYINDQPCTVQQLKQLGRHLVHVHGQHEHHALLHTDVQRQRLDNFAEADELLGQTRHHYQQWQQALKKVNELTQQQAEHIAQQALLRYQIEEATALDLGADELEQLHQEHYQLSNAHELIQHCQQAQTQLHISDDNIISQLHYIQQLLQGFSQHHPSLAGANQIIEESTISLQEAAKEIEHYAQGVEIDPERLQHVEARLNQIHDIARKHQVTPEGLYAHIQDLFAQQAAVDHLEADLATAQASAEQEEMAYRDAAKLLSDKRRTAIKALCPKVTQSMHALGMEGGEFTIHCTDLDTPSESGVEKLEYFVTTNPGQPLQPLSKVVSGGELSRIGLAIQVLTAERQPTPTLIFDEVDVGIGGATAEVVGKLLAELGSHCQVLCITHLPQVAAQGQQHLFVRKHKTEDTTHTAIDILDADQRIEEIARMLGGVNITTQTRATAAEMLEKAT